MSHHMMVVMPYCTKRMLNSGVTRGLSHGGQSLAEGVVLVTVGVR